MKNNKNRNFIIFNISLILIKLSYTNIYEKRKTYLKREKSKKLELLRIFVFLKSKVMIYKVSQSLGSNFILTFLFLSMTRHAGCTKSDTPKLAQSHKPPESQLFELSLMPLEVFTNSKLISWLRLDTHDHVPEVLS